MNVEKLKVETYLTGKLIELLEGHREMRIEFFEYALKVADTPKLESYYRDQVETYKEVGYEYLAEGYLSYQAHLGRKKTD